MWAYLVMCIIAGAEHHSIALDATHVARLQVADYNHVAVLSSNGTGYGRVDALWFIVE
jgi:hypothetical protein